MKRASLLFVLVAVLAVTAKAGTVLLQENFSGATPGPNNNL